MFICIHKINFIPNFVHKILNFEKSSNLISREPWSRDTHHRKTFNSFEGLHFRKRIKASHQVLYEIFHFLKILKFYWLSRHAWPGPPKMVAPPCRKLWCLSASKKINLVPHFDHKIYYTLLYLFIVLLFLYYTILHFQCDLPRALHSRDHSQLTLSSFWSKLTPVVIFVNFCQR